MRVLRSPLPMVELLKKCSQSGVLPARNHKPGAHFKATAAAAQIREAAPRVTAELPGNMTPVDN
ncbi:MAG: hypothetical protein QM800_06760 [Paludibacter sp.]